MQSNLIDKLRKNISQLIFNKHFYQIKNFLYNVSHQTDENVVRFLMVGSINTLIGFLAFPFIYWFFSAYRKHYVGMLILSQFICMTISFLTNKIFVFKSKNKISHEVFKFSLFHGICFLINININPFIVNTFGLHPVIVQTGLNVLIVVTTYFWYEKIVFPSNHFV